MARTSRDGALGAAGEHHARLLLEGRGYHLVTRNWRCSAGELDLVMLDGDELVFVEVKTRRGERAGRADEAVTPTKARRMLSAAEWFLADHPEHEDRIWRCDLVAITIHPRTGTAQAQHYVNAIVVG
jgi:putative endonuclease